MYVLKIKKGKNIGKYVGKKGIRSWDWKPQDSIQKARIFSKISGIKNFHGKVYDRDKKAELDKLWKNELNKYLVRKEYLKRYKDIEIPYNEYYEVIEISIKDNTEG